MKIRCRMQAKGTWEALSAIHVGGEPDGFESNVDMSLLRDESGAFYIPGASIAGACRSHLARYSLKDADYRKGRDQEPAALQALFGGKYASLLSFWDAECSFALAGPHTRDGVRIDSANGIAADHAKYNFEVLATGSKFEFRIEVLLYDELPLRVLHKEVRVYLRALLDGLCGDIRIGAKTRKGLGRGGILDWRIFELDMAKEEHVRAWLNGRWEEGKPILKLTDLSPDVPLDHRRTFTIHARLRLKTSILIRSGGDKAGLPDSVHLTENGKPLLTGTSLAGVLRHRVERIANTMIPDPDEARRLVEGMFGPLHNSTRNRDGLRAGRVRVQETGFESGTHLVQGRVAIDRFTQGALDQFLFDEAALYPRVAGHHCAVQIELNLPERDRQDDREIALLLQAFKDLWLGDASIGGEAGVGRGVFDGCWAKFESPELPTLEFESSSEDAALRFIRGDLAAWEEIAASLRQEAANG